MKMHKRIAAMLLSVLTLALILPVQAFAAASINLKKNVNLTISYQDDDTPLTGVQFDIYLVATVDESGELTATETFAPFNVNISGNDDAAWRVLASTLEGYVQRDNIAPTDSGKTDEEGILTFPNETRSLKQGLYLVMGHRLELNGTVYETEPFMVQLPSLDPESSEWIYDVIVKPKHEDKPEEDACTITRKVLKIWKDNGHKEERPKEIVVQLLRDGEVYDSVTLNAANNWRYTWSDLDADHRWTVVEKELDGYTVEVTRVGITFVVTNTYDEEIPEEPTPTEPTAPSEEPTTPSEEPTTPSDEPTTPPEEPSEEPTTPSDEPGTPTESTAPSDGPTTPPDEPGTPGGPKLPQTGQLWWPVPVLITAGLTLIVIGLLRRKGAAYEE